MLQKAKIPARVVSVPSFELFAAQPEKYRKAVIGSAKVRIAVEAAVGQGWERFIGDDGIFIGMNGLWRVRALREALRTFRHHARSHRQGGKGKAQEKRLSGQRNKRPEKEIMTVRIAINGFGRIGRNVVRAIYESGRKDIDIVAVNDLGPVETNAHLMRYDSVHGRFPHEVTVEGDTISVGKRKLQGARRARPVQAALEGNGRRHRHGMHRHLHRQRQGRDAP